MSPRCPKGEDSEPLGSNSWFEGYPFGESHGDNILPLKPPGDNFVGFADWVEES
jgi:hypothetical protein